MTYKKYVHDTAQSHKSLLQKTKIQQAKLPKTSLPPFLKHIKASHIDLEEQKREYIDKKKKHKEEQEDKEREQFLEQLFINLRAGTMPPKETDEWKQIEQELEYYTNQVVSRKNEPFQIIKHRHKKTPVSDADIQHQWQQMKNRVSAHETSKINRKIKTVLKKISENKKKKTRLQYSGKV